MPATLFSRIDPGQPAGHTVLGDRLTNMAAAVNDLPLEAVEPHSLTRQHLPSVIVGTPKTTALDNAIGAEHIYSSQAAAEPYPGWNTLAGWKVINDVGTAGSATMLRLTGLNITLDANTSIEVWAEVEVVDIELWDFTAGPPARSAAVASAARVFGCFAVQYGNAVGTLNHLSRTERYIRAESTDDAGNLVGAVAHQTVAQQGKRVTIATRIRNTDPAGAITVNVVQMVVSCHRGGFGLATQHCRVRLRKGRISAFGKRHGTLT